MWNPVRLTHSLKHRQLNLEVINLFASVTPVLAKPVAETKCN